MGCLGMGHLEMGCLVMGRDWTFCDETLEMGCLVIGMFSNGTFCDETFRDGMFSDWDV